MVTRFLSGSKTLRIVAVLTLGGLYSLLRLGAGPASAHALASAAGGHSCHGFSATIVGTTGADNLTGTPGNDDLQGDAGDDDLDGGSGDDLEDGGNGDDSAVCNSTLGDDDDCQGDENDQGDNSQ